MNEDGTPIEAGAAGAPEGAVAEPKTDDIKQMYDELGIKAPVPSGKAKGRPKANAGGSGKDSEENNAGGTAGKGQANDDGRNQSKTASAPNSNGRNGDAADQKGTQGGSQAGKDGGTNGKVSKSSEGDEGGVQEDESRNNQKTANAGEGDDDEGDGGAGKNKGEQGSASEEGKRPGKSNPEVERRIQKLANESREKDTRIEELERQIRENQVQQRQDKFAAEDPEYTVDDFRKVRDEQGNILELDQNQAELAWRRWKDSYEQRKAEHDAQVNHDQAIEEYKAEATRKLVESSVQAYDTLVGILDSYPELNPQNVDQFDQAFSDSIMPIIEDMIIYQPGTEPGNPNNYQSVIVGMRMNPAKILDVISKVKAQKRSLPLNGTDANVEPRSNVSVPHSRSSDPTVNAANELYKELGIDKRL